jgi:endonuclease-3
MPRRSAPQGPGPVGNRELPAIFRHLRKEAARKEAPVVTLIAVTTREPWRVLSSCILSLRTQDGTTAKAAARMFARWPTVEAMASADADEVAKVIYPVGFYRTKAPQLVEMAGRIVSEWGGRVPDEIDELLKLKGVGRKTANLVVIAGYGKPGICVDTHVHRIANLWGYVATRTPEETEAALREKLPRRYWMEINDLLVSFGQTVCRPTSPKCSECPIDRWCPKLGVTRRR